MNLFGQEPAFAAPPVQILVGTTSIKLHVNKKGNIGNGVSLAPFMTQYLKEREWVPRFAAYVTTCNYSIYDEDTGYASLPRYVLKELTAFLTSNNVNYELVDVAPVKPRPIKLKLKKNFAPREDQPQVIKFMTSDAPYKPISAQTGSGKCCPLDTPIRVPGGWSTHGTIQVGDDVTVWDGSTSKVSGVYPQGLKKLFRVSFEDERVLDVGREHLWSILFKEETDSQVPKSQVVDTQELLSFLNGGRYHNVCVPLANSEITHDVYLPTDPYLLGNDLAVHQRAIPEIFLNASHDQRIALVNGILDTLNDDTLFIHNRQEGDCTISIAVSDEAFAKDIVYLIRSLGGKSSILVKMVKLGTPEQTEEYMIDATYAYPKLLFTDPLRKEKFAGCTGIDPLNLGVVSVTPLMSEAECVCISIDHPEQLYVAGDFITTHNTFCAEAAICELGVTTLIVLGSLVDQWYKSLRMHTNIASHEIYVVQGIEPLKKLWEGIRNGYRPKVLIFSTRTLFNYAVERKGPYLDLPSYAKLQEVLGIGMKIVDEVHMNFYTNTRIDLVSNIAHNIYLSATYDRNNYQGRRIFNMVFPKDLRFGEEFQKKFTTVHMLRYRLGIQVSDSQKMRTPKGYNHALYENFLRKRSEFFNYFMKTVVLPVIRMYYLNVRKPGQLMLILCQTRKFAIRLGEYLEKNLPSDISKSVFFSGEKGKYGADKNLKCDIIISTHKSCGTGRDIKNLKSCLNTVSFASAPLSGQVLGRLREIPGEETIFIDIWNMEINSHIGHHNDRLEVYKTKALKLFESEIC